MESKNEEWNAFLTAEVLVFRLLGRLLYQPPEAAWLQLLAEENIFAETPLGMGTPKIEAGLALMQEWALAYLADSNGELQSALEGDYNRLFVGPAKVLAPPWESVYLTKERLIFQEQTLQVRSWFRRFGLEVENLYHEPDDHIGLELLFLAHLAELSVAALEADEQTEFADLLAAQWQFLNAHPLRWVFDWARDVQEFARQDFYKGIALLTVGGLTEVQTRFAEQFAES